MISVESLIAVGFVAFLPQSEKILTGGLSDIIASWEQAAIRMFSVQVNSLTSPGSRRKWSGPVELLKASKPQVCIHTNSFISSTRAIPLLCGSWEAQEHGWNTLGMFTGTVHRLCALPGMRNSTHLPCQGGLDDLKRSFLTQLILYYSFNHLPAVSSLVQHTLKTPCSGLKSLRSPRM